MTAAISLEDLPAVRSDEQVPLNQWGQYLIVPQGGTKPEPHTRVTTFASTLDDRYGLEKWGLRMAALGFANRQDLYAKLCGTRADDKGALDKLCAEAKEAAAASAGANMGTGLHGLAELVDLGEREVGAIPEPFRADIAAYCAALEAAGIGIVDGMVERNVVLPDHKLAGKLDRIVTFGSKPMVADLKTGADLAYSWASIAVQLACYANAATLYNGKTQKHSPMPDVDRDVALVIHLPAGQATCTLHFVDIAAGWEAAQHAAWVRQWRKRKDLAEPWQPGTRLDSVIERRANLANRIEALRAHSLDAVKELALNWPLDIPTLKHSSAHTIEQLDAIAALITGIEDKYGAPFGPKDPSNGKVIS